jgi:alkanesulfonate monooxygenase SsuD/methylene tetrahydromethanopterin reductase-like flavin-dependent oxidoreductase (luciferase family)
MCCPTDEEARAKADGWTFFVFCLEFLHANVWEPGTVNLWERYQDWRRTPAAVSTFQSGLIGSPATVRDRLRQFAATGIDQVVLLNQAGQNTHEDICASLELFASEVMPEFHALEPAHQEWKADVLAGRVTLDDIDTAGHLTAIAQSNPATNRFA